MPQCGTGAGAAKPGASTKKSGDRVVGTALERRWALEEVEQPYEVHLLSFAALKQPAHLRRHPFGQFNAPSDQQC